MNKSGYKRILAATLLPLLFGVGGSGCIADLIPDPPDYAVPPDSSAMDISDFDVDDSDAESDAPVCRRNCWDRVCGPDDCGGTCGTCPTGTVCAGDYSICLVKSVLLPDGAFCGRNAACEPMLPDPYEPDAWYENPDWPNCLDHQCSGLVCERGMCTSTCQVRNDSVYNGTSFQTPDNIEDDTTDSDCRPASGDVWTGATMCVGRYRGTDGGIRGVCLPASSFSPCNPGDACPGLEECTYVNIMGTMERRCMSKSSNGAETGASCGFDSVSASTAVCGSWLCSNEGCTVPCDIDTDCLTPDAVCESGLCRGTGRTCSSDTDCSVSVCGTVSIDGIDVRACSPASCSGDLDCPGNGHYCAAVIDVDESGQPVAAGRCRPVVEGGAAPGAKCGQVGGAVAVCRNREMCIDGMCSARCSDDFDCYIYGNMRCAFTQEYVSGGFSAPGRWVSWGYCLDTGYGPEGCRSDADCGDAACVPWTRFGDSGSDVATTCMAPPADSWPLGAQCGRFAWDAVCRSRFCFDEDAVRGVPGWCSQACAVDSDCPEHASIGETEYRWVCSAKVVSGLASSDVSDDLYASWCVPVPAASSLVDCSGTLSCVESGQTCRPVLRAGPAVNNERVDYLCMQTTGAVQVGGFCNPAGNGSECSSAICAPSTISGLGFCSAVCGSDQACAVFGEGVVCQQVRMGSSAAGVTLSSGECRMKGACVVCDQDSDCSSGYRCVNISGSYWVSDMRCVKECLVESDCTAEPGTTCAAVNPVFTVGGESISACMTPVCPG